MPAAQGLGLLPHLEDHNPGYGGARACLLATDREDTERWGILSQRLLLLAYHRFAEQAVAPQTDG
jgi:hypothetical protein